MALQHGMLKIPLRWFAALCVCAMLVAPAVFAGVNGEPARPFVLSGVVKESGNTDVFQRFVDYLSERSGYSLKPAYADSYEALSQQLRRDSGAVGWTCGAPFVQDHAADGQQLLAVPLFNGKPTYRSLVITQRDRKADRLVDFAGGVLAYSDPRSNSGFVAPAYALHQAGLNIGTYFRLLLRAGNHEHSIEAVVNGLADVAAVDEFVWVEYVRSHPEARRQLRVIERYGPYPFTPLVAGRTLPPDALHSLQEALTGMAADPEGRKLLTELGLDGFVVRTAEFFEPIGRMLRSLAAAQHETGS
jgi:phosphonate transport system substrate-binding protein